jgi:hypothetical protein
MTDLIINLSQIPQPFNLRLPTIIIINISSS